VRWLAAVCACGVLCAGAARAFPRSETPPVPHDVGAAFVESVPIIDEVVFAGLRRISPAAVQAQISSRVGQRLDSHRIESDVRALARLGWFGDIRVETRLATESPAAIAGSAQHLRLVFFVDEEPYLSQVEYAGSRLLNHKEIEKILREKGILLRPGEPKDSAKLERIARTIQTALAELGHPKSIVQVHREEPPNATLRVRFEILDGPRIPVGRVEFEGHPAVPAKTLQQQMRRIAPGAVFASLRGKDAFTKGGFEEDREEILAYYQNHGFPEAHVGNALTSAYEETQRRWFPWPHRSSKQRLAISVHIEAGPFCRQIVEMSPDLAEASGRHRKKLETLAAAETGKPYAAKNVENLRRVGLASVQPRPTGRVTAPFRNVEASQNFDPENRIVRMRLNLSDAPTYIVRHIEFPGAHRFRDRYFRRRIIVREGQPLDERALETGLAQLARTGYFHKFQKEDVRVQTDDVTHTADVTIRIREAGQQRAFLSGGRGQFGGTLGVVYTLFDLFQREELLSAQLDGGPESLQIMLGLAKEGFFGSRGTLAISVFNNVLRPHFATSPKGPFYTSQSAGLNAGWSYAVTSTDSLAINYALSRTYADYSTPVPANLTGLTSGDIRARTSSSSVGLGWTHDGGSERITLANMVSGGVLGGSENLLRSSGGYSRIFADPFFNRQNAWAFRSTFSAAGSYLGDMPIYARLFSGDEMVRGLRSGELGPNAVVSTTSTSGNQTYTTIPAGANLITAANAEYRIPLGGGAEVAGFFDLGSGRLLPNWLGHARPSLLDSTNGILHGSTGIELRWKVPGVQVPVRTYYSVNVLRLNRFLQLPDGSLFHVHNRFSAFGWALGTLF
jgi:outer membrane protein assembly complex protein YaeT